MKPICKEYAKRFLLCTAALVFFGLGNALGVKAGAVGTNAWGTLAIGVSRKLGISYGMANMGIGLIIVLIDLTGVPALPLRSEIGGA